MCYMAITVNKLIAASNLKAADLSRMSGITESAVSRVRQGVQAWVSPETATAMAQAFARRIHGESIQTIHAQLLYARLRDECSGPGAKLLQVKLLSEPEKTKTDLVETKALPVLPPRIQENLDIIAGHISKCRHVRDLVEIIANFCRNAKSTECSISGDDCVGDKRVARQGLSATVGNNFVREEIELPMRSKDVRIQLGLGRSFF
jgi:hypothetical protein